LSGERVNAMKERAGVFLELASELADRGRLDIASFSVQQACQLRVKASLLRLTGEMPRIHSIRELLGILAKRMEEIGHRDEAEKITGFVRESRRGASGHRGCIHGVSVWSGRDHGVRCEGDAEGGRPSVQTVGGGREQCSGLSTT